MARFKAKKACTLPKSHRYVEAGWEGELPFDEPPGPHFELVKNKPKAETKKEPEQTAGQGTETEKKESKSEQEKTEKQEKTGKKE